MPLCSIIHLAPYCLYAHLVLEFQYVFAAYAQ